MSTSNTLIAGQYGGKKVYVVPRVKPTYQLLYLKAKAGNHWARLAVLGLLNLASGRLGKDNIFVKPNLMVAQGVEEFFVFLPGCKACVERLPNDSYKIVSLTVDSGYFEANSQNKMTGLYSTAKSDQGWDVAPIENGQLRQDGSHQRFVGISDGVHKDAEDAARNMAPLVAKAPGGGGVFFTKYDLHYTPGRTSFGGLKNYNLATRPLTNSDIHGSALMLAYTMTKAKDIKGISWVAEFGGSAVLTQAMKILVDNGVQLKHHSAFLYRPSTTVDQAARLAHQLGVKLDRNFAHTTTFDYMGNRDQVAMIYNRFKAEKDYKAGNACFDLVCQGKNVQGIAGMAITAVGAAGASIALPAIPILAHLGAALGVTAGALKMGSSLAEAITPYWYNKHIGKIK